MKKTILIFSLFLISNVASSQSTEERVKEFLRTLVGDNFDVKKQSGKLKSSDCFKSYSKCLDTPSSLNKYKHILTSPGYLSLPANERKMFREELIQYACISKRQNCESQKFSEGNAAVDPM